MPQHSIAKTLKRPSIQSGLLLTFSSVCLALLILETVVRFLPPPYEADTGEFFTCHNELGWIGAPNFQGEFKYKEIDHKISFNALGMHDTDHPQTKDGDTFRILMLGDSFVQAVQVSREQTARQLLEDALNAGKSPGAPRFEVISGGVINWGTNQELLYYRAQGRYFQPDLVLLMFYLGNDLQDNLPGNVLTVKGFNCYAPYFVLCQGALIPTPIAYAPGLSRLQEYCAPSLDGAPSRDGVSPQQGLVNALGRLYQYSRLYQQLEPLIVANRPRQEFGRAYPSAFSALYLPQTEAELQQAWQITQALIARLRQEVEANGGRFAVAIISPEIVIRLALLSPAEQAVFLRDNPNFAQAQLDRPNARLARFLQQQNISFIDLTGPMVEHAAATGAPLYIIGEGHWTVEGNRAAADILAWWLKQHY
jgi:hypothetical protein